MFFVLVEISNFRQLSRLRSDEAKAVRGLLEHFCQNRGGRLAREQNGFFLFTFHPLREKVLDQVADFLLITAETLRKKKEELYGFSLLLEQDEASDEASVFVRLKNLIFLAPEGNRVWAGPQVLAVASAQFPINQGEPLSEILGPPLPSRLPPLEVEQLWEITGWVDALKTALTRQLSGGEEQSGQILRLRGAHWQEKYYVLRIVLHQLYGAHEDFPVFFPLEDSRDWLSQLLARVNPEIARRSPQPEDPAWEALLVSRGGGEYPGDSSQDDVVEALKHYFRQLISLASEQHLPAIFVFLLPHQYESDAQEALQHILGELIVNDGLKVLLLEPQERTKAFLSALPSLTWSFPPLSMERLRKERDAREWQDRFPVLSDVVLEACHGRGMSWVHHLWSLQSDEVDFSDGDDPSWTVFLRLDPAHHKVYFLLWAARGLMEARQVVDFLSDWGEDRAVIEDKIHSLTSMGFLLRAIPRPLRPDFGEKLSIVLGEEGRGLLKALGLYLFHQWSHNPILSEVLFRRLSDWGHHSPSRVVLAYYLTNKISQGHGEFLSLLRRPLWASSQNEDVSEPLKLTAAAAKLRYGLNFPRARAGFPRLDRIRRSFGPKTETYPCGEWQLQLGRYHLKKGELSAGFPLLKKALAMAQERDDRSLEVRAQVEIGLALLRKGRTEEGREYLGIASKAAEKSGSPYLISMTMGLDAVALFLLGHLTGARHAIARASQAARNGGARRWLIFLGFLKARLLFDQGDYSGASATLLEASEVARRYRVHEALPILDAWRGRVLAYAGNLSAARSCLEGLAPTAEGNYFLAEVFYFEHDLAGALGLVGSARKIIAPTQPFGHGEGILWLSGYASIEDRTLPGPGMLGVLANQLEAFELFLTASQGHLEAIDQFPGILARKSLLDHDPASALFYYWYSMALPKQDHRHEALRLTLIGRSMKDIQTRSSRIEDPIERHEYLIRPFWNARFTAEAKRLKLL